MNTNTNTNKDGIESPMIHKLILNQDGVVTKSYLEIIFSNKIIKDQIKRLKNNSN